MLSQFRRRKTVLALVIFGACVSGSAEAGETVRLAARKVVVSPDTPRAGRIFTAFMHVTRRDTGATVRSGKVTCSARVGRLKLTLLARGFRTARVYSIPTGTRARLVSMASCTWRLPASARGKHVDGWIRVDALGAFTRRYFGRPIL